MAGVARFDPGKGVVSATESYARSKAYATSATPKSGPVMNTMGFRNGPVGVKPPSDDLATVIVLPFVVDTRVATSCHQMGAGEPI